jgi:PAS domain S-box-containing protein
LSSKPTYEELKSRAQAIEQQVAASHQIESALHESEERYGRLSKNLQVVLYAAFPDKLTSKFFVSEQIEALTGYAATQFRSEAGLFFRIIHPRDHDRVAHEILRAIEGQTRIDLEYRIITRDEQIRWIRDKASPINTEHKAIRFEGILEDITEREKTDRALREARQTFITILDSIDATIYVADMDTHEILFMNRHMKNAFGGDFAGQNCWEAFRNKDGPCADCTNDKLIDDSGNPTGVCIWEGYNKVTDRWHLNHDRAVRWIDGRNVRLQVATDITQLKSLEKERHRTEAQLRQAQKMEAIGTLAGGIAHDFNNILSAILGYSELALDDALHERTSEPYIRQILKAGGRARDLVQQILTFSRQTETEAKPIQVKPIVKEALKLLRASLPSTIEIRPDIQSEAIVEADPIQIHQVIMNLCTNAGHAMRETGGTLKVTLINTVLDRDFTDHYREMAPGDHLKIEVSDTGPGIPAEYLDKIFDPYFTTKEKGEGTGMGLAVVQAIVQGCKGAVIVEPAEPNGVSFKIYLPIIYTDQPTKTKLDAIIPGGNERILFIDDEPPLAELTKQLLERFGYQVTIRTSSIEALALFKSQPEAFDLVITDMTMPHMTGDQLAAELMSIRSQIPVIICTGYSQKVTRDLLERLNIKALILKPVIRDELLISVRQVLDDALEK